jgi:hypothetical protein
MDVEELAAVCGDRIVEMNLFFSSMVRIPWYVTKVGSLHRREYDRAAINTNFLGVSIDGTMEISRSASGIRTTKAGMASRAAAT